MMDKKLYQRVCDIYAGAIGHPFVEDEDYLGAKELAQVITALASVFDPEGKEKDRFGRWNIEEFETPEKATEHIEFLLQMLETN